MLSRIGNWQTILYINVKLSTVRKISLSLTSLICFCLQLSLSGFAQGTSKEGLFDKEEPLQITLKGELNELMNDRGATPAYHNVSLVYTGADNMEFNIPIKAKTRGHFRLQRANCGYPPLLLNFTKGAKLDSTIFTEQDKLKLVMPCRQDDYVIREYMVYKLHNLVTPKSYRARLVKVVLEDTKKNKKGNPLWGIFIEEDKQVAKRNNAVVMNTKNLNSGNTDPDDYLITMVFEFLIGNVDWSLPYLHNIKLIAKDSTAIPSPIAYDYDHSGLVDAPYAMPPEQLDMTSVRERRYRGVCMPDQKSFAKVFDLFNKLKPDIYALYTNSKLLDPKYIKETTRYFDEFYNTINSPKEFKFAFGYPCRESKNVSIKGMDNDDN